MFIAFSGTTFPLFLGSLRYEIDDFHNRREIYYEFCAQKTVSSVWPCKNGLVVVLKVYNILNRHCKSECYRLQLVL
jgi:hypothetical protein